MAHPIRGISLSVALAAAKGQVSEMTMKVWTCNDHHGHWPVGAASVVVAESALAANIALDRELLARGLKPYIEHPYTLVPLDTEKAGVVVLLDGDY